MPETNIKNEHKSAMAAAEASLTPALAKRITEMFSLKPKPPMETGSNVMAPMMGINIIK